MIDYTTMDNAETFVPHHMRDGYKLYIEHGISPGSFGQAVIRGDMEGAYARADWININHIETQMKWVKQNITNQKGNTDD